MKITEHDALTGESFTRDATAEELAQHEIDVKAIAQEKAEEAADAKAKESAKAALLAKLGITAEEAALLLG